MCDWPEGRPDSVKAFLLIKTYLPDMMTWQSRGLTTRQPNEIRNGTLKEEKVARDAETILGEFSLRPNHSYRALMTQHWLTQFSFVIENDLYQEPMMELKTI